MIVYECINAFMNKKEGLGIRDLQREKIGAYVLFPSSSGLWVKLEFRIVVIALIPQ